MLANADGLRKTLRVKTVLTRSAARAAGFIRTGGTVAFPTETVYGLGANVFDAEAVAKVFDAKRRPADNPLIAHIFSTEQIAGLAKSVSPAARRFVSEFFPGPLTLVLRRSDAVPLIATAGLDTIGVRMPGSALAIEFLRASATPVVAPSANLSGRPSPTTWQAVLEDLDGRIDCILQGDATEIGLESTVVDCSADPPVLLRQGAVSLGRLREIVPETLDGTNMKMDVVRSPGLRHKHYSPRAKVFIVEDGLGNSGGPGTAYIGLRTEASSAGYDLIKICLTVDDYARSVFEFFRECDRNGIQRIYCGAVPPVGIGAAVMDRLRRAAE